MLADNHHIPSRHVKDFEFLFPPYQEASQRQDDITRKDTNGKTYGVQIGPRKIEAM